MLGPFPVHVPVKRFKTGKPGQGVLGPFPVEFPVNQAFAKGQPRGGERATGKAADLGCCGGHYLKMFNQPFDKGKTGGDLHFL